MEIERILEDPNRASVFCRRVPIGKYRSTVRAFFYPRSEGTIQEYFGYEPIGCLQSGCCTSEIMRSFNWFDDVVITLAIMVNVVVLALYDPTDRTSEWNQHLDYVDNAITYLFVLELFIRWTSFGTRNYFNDVWRVMDFLIVAGSVSSVIAGYIPSVDSDHAKGLVLLRSARMLRPFKTMTRFPSVKILAVSLVQSFKGLLDITTLFTMFLLIFGVSATSQYKGRMLGRCVNDMWLNNTIQRTIAVPQKMSIADFVCGGQLEQQLGITSSIACSPDQLCDMQVGSSILLRGYRCPYGYTCRNVDHNPSNGFVSFDNAAFSIFTLFVMVTLEGWADVMYALMDAVGPHAAAFCVAVVLLGSFFILRLAVVLITVAFQKAKEEEEERQKLQAEKLGGRSRSKTMNSRLRALVAARTQQQQDAHPTPLTCMGKVNLLIEKVRVWVSTRVLQKRRFTMTVPFVILLNILIMMSDHFGQSQGMEKVQTISNLFFSIIYTIELILRLMGTEWWKFWKDALNVFDVIVVVVGWCDIAIDSFHVPFVRSLRALRVVKLLQSLPSVYLWISIIAKCLINSVALMFLIFMFVFVFACMGMQFFGGYFCNLTGDLNTDICPGRPRSNFDAFGSAMITCFQILTGDNWNEVMYDGMRSRGIEFSGFFLVFYYVGNNVLVNILIGILLTARSTIAEKEAEELQQITNYDPAAPNGLLYAPDELEMHLMGSREGGRMTSPNSMDSLSAGFSPDASISQQAFMGISLEASQVIETINQTDGTIHFNSNYMRAETINEVEVFDMQSIVDAAEEDHAVSKKKGKTAFPIYKDEQDLPQHVLRKAIRQIMGSRYAEIVISFLILGNCLSMAMEDPIYAPDQQESVILRLVDLCFTLVFCIEWILLNVAFGFGIGKHSYLGRSKWNVFDTFIVITMIFGTAVTTLSTISFLKVSSTVRTIATLRALRPLRFVKRSPTLKVVFNSLLRSFIPVKNIMIVATLLFTVWGIMGVALFKGAFYSCTDPSITERKDCLAQGYRWVNAPNHFNHIFAAFSSLFILTALDGWPQLMYLGIDARSHDEAPKANAHPLAATYFLFFVVLSGFFVVNLFTSVLIDTYEMERKRNGGSSYMTPEQNAWAEAHTFIVRAIPRLPPAARPDRLSQLRGKIWKLVSSTGFDHLIHFAIVINMLVLALDHYPSPKGTSDSLQYINYFFVAAFVVEAALKLFAFRRKYFNSKWNCWDFFVCVLSIVGAVAEALFNMKSVTAGFRSVRVLRLLRAIRSLEKIRKIMNSFLMSLVPLGNVTAVTFLIFFIFGVWGMNLFGHVMRTGVLNGHCNFESIQSAILTLFRIATGDNTPAIVFAYGVEEPVCLERIGNCGNALIAQIFFQAFLLLGMFILLNLFTAVIVESFHSMDVDAFMKFNKSHAQAFIEMWRLYDRDLQLKIRTSELVPLMNKMPISNPLSIRFHLGNLFLPAEKRLGELRFIKAIGLMETPSADVLLKDVITCLCQAAYAQAAPQSTVRAIHKRMEKKLKGHGVEEAATEPAYIRIAVLKIEKAWLRNREDFLLRRMKGELPLRKKLTEAEVEQLVNSGLYDMI